MSANEAAATGERALLVGRTRTLLREHIPLCLLLDLADPAGPDSAEHFATEPADLGWLRRPVPPARSAADSGGSGA